MLPPMLDHCTCVFLSTPPSRVATPAPPVLVLPAPKVSIHATLAGGDGILSYMANSVFDVSIHATLAGGDGYQCARSNHAGEVSIHATLAGGDKIPPINGANGLSFYPRHPRGWRHTSGLASFSASMFLSTPPSRVATLRLSKQFSST